jgi:vitamin B12 transporter
MKQKLIRSKRLVQFRQWANKRYSAFNSLKRTIKICTLAVAYSIVSEPVNVKAEGGDSTSLKTLEMDDVVVQSTLLELKSAQTGRSIEVIQSAQILSLPVTTIDELLRYIPGVETQSRGAFGAQTDFSLRGSNFNQVLVLIDGQKINDPLTAHFNSNIPISPSEIERIEIIKGSASAEYGPDATGGVINIISKTFSEKKQSKQNLADIKLIVGQHKLINTDAGFFNEREKFKIAGGVLINKSDGNLMESGLKNYFDIRTYSLSGYYNLSSNWSAAYRYGFDYRDFNAQWYYSSSPADSATEHLTRNRHQLQITRNKGNSSTIINSSYYTTNDDFFFNSKSRAINKSDFGMIKISHQLTFSNTLSAIAGVEADRKSVVSNNRGNHSIFHFGSFAIASFSANSIFVINAALRGDYDKKYGFFPLPQISASYKLAKQVLLRTAIGKSIRTPDFTELYYNNYPISISAGNRIGNRDLNVEKSWNYEMGCDLNILNNLSFGTTSFFRQTKNLIDYVSTTTSSIPYLTNLIPDSTYWYAVNNSNTNTFGIENKISYKYFFDNNINTSITIGYTYLDIKSDFYSKPLYILLHAKHLINGDVLLHYSRITFHVNGVYKVRESQVSKTINRYLKKSFAVWNTATDVRIYKQNVFINFTIYNIFDMNYSDFLGAEMPGRWLAGGLKVKF